jgi:FAD/FMN-containing dehydrogenase
MLTRREVLRSAALAALSAGCARLVPTPRPRVVLNDIHSQLNESVVDRVLAIDSLDGLRAAIRTAGRDGESVSIAGGRHAMGGQQFGAGTVNLDMRSYARVVRFDPSAGLVEVESGIQWPALIDELLTRQAGAERQWSISQKQTGADRLTIGGSLAANIHGRGLTLPPFVHDIEEFTLVDAAGELHRCSRGINRELFALAIGGYGLFGAVATVTLRLAPRVKMRRVVEVREIDGLLHAVSDRITEGFLYGDFQFSIDERSPNFMRRGVFSCYQPVDPSTPEAPNQLELSEAQWAQLFALGHFDKAKAYDLYTSYYLSTNGQVYWSDLHQLSIYIDDYHRAIDARTGARGSEMISEVYVPRALLTDFMEEARADFLANAVNVFYGTVRFIERDEETFLAWARQPYACIVFNFHIDHSAAGRRKAAEDFRRLIDMAIKRDGSYYLTYHRFARRDQVERCYPQLPQMLRLKRKFDPRERFQSDWYRFYRSMFAA